MRALCCVFLWLCTVDSPLWRYSASLLNVLPSWSLCVFCVRVSCILQLDGEFASQTHPHVPTIHNIRILCTCHILQHRTIFSVADQLSFLDAKRHLSPFHRLIADRFHFTFWRSLIFFLAIILTGTAGGLKNKDGEMMYVSVPQAWICLKFLGHENSQVISMHHVQVNMMVVHVYFKGPCFSVVTKLAIFLVSRILRRWTLK